MDKKTYESTIFIYVDLESLLEKMSTCHNNPKKSLTTKTNTHLQIIFYLIIVHLMLQKTCFIIIEAKTA